MTGQFQYPLRLHKPVRTVFLYCLLSQFISVKEKKSGNCNRYGLTELWSQQPPKSTQHPPPHPPLNLNLLDLISFLIFRLNFRQGGSFVTLISLSASCKPPVIVCQ